ncbi:MAG: histidine phosphatase family protein, partial [Chloroflexi bacterium]|nr:histidine phosphatase family protein [Chloroflexota bacterium]
MKWYIVRHAEKEKGDFYNPKLRHQDEPISQRGQKQAEQLWEFFSARPVNGIYISQYQRTGQTIQFVSKKNGLHPVVDERLN